MVDIFFQNFFGIKSVEYISFGDRAAFFKMADDKLILSGKITQLFPTENSVIAIFKDEVMIRLLKISDSDL